MKTHWPVHTIALLFPVKTPEERAELKQDMVERVARGLDPLESPNPCFTKAKSSTGGTRTNSGRSWPRRRPEFFAGNQPPTETFQSPKHGTLAAWMRAKLSQRGCASNRRPTSGRQSSSRRSKPTRS